MTSFTPKELGVGIAQAEFRDWPARFKLFQEPLNLEHNQEAHGRAFEIEVAIYFSHEVVFSLFTNQKTGFSETELEQFCTGFHQATAELLATHGWKIKDFSRWRKIRDERFREYRGLTTDLIAGENKYGPSLKFGRAFIKHALPKSKLSDIEILPLCDAINYHTLCHITASAKAIQEIIANGKKSFWQRLFGWVLNAPVDD